MESRLLFVFERDMATVSITRQCFNEISKEYDVPVTFKWVKDIKKSDIERNDIVIFIRPNDALSLKLAKLASKSGCLTVCMLDDDLLSLGKDRPFAPWRKKALKKIVGYCDGVMSSSSYILQKYGAMSKAGRKITINTIVSKDEFLKQTENYKDEKVKIVYAAGTSHAVLFEKYISPIMYRLEEKYGEAIEWTFVSVSPDVPDNLKKMNIKYVKGMNLEDYRRFMHSACFDIGVAPLEDDEFTKCKYFNKYLEYSTAGVCGVYSNVEPYTFVIQDGKNGYLADNILEDWFYCICRAIDNTNERKACIENSKNHILDTFSLEGVFSQLCADIPEINSFEIRKEKRCKSLGLYKAVYYLYRICDYVYLSVWYLFHGGIKGFIKKVRMHQREKGAYAK